MPETIHQMRRALYTAKATTPLMATSVGRFPARRYAGGEDLSRGRYYTVCKTGNDDAGTLLAELEAYLSVFWSGPIEITDTAYRSDRAGQRLHHLLPGHLLFRFYETAGIRNRFFSWLEHFGLPFEQQPDGTIKYETTPEKEAAADQFQNRVRWPDGTEYVQIIVPYSATDVEHASVFDLRNPTAQQWLVEFIDRTTCIRPNNFEALLPHLLIDSRGGNEFTEFIGRELRANGADGLVYPSARRNCYVDYDGSDVDDFGGFNFLDLTDSPRIEANNFPRFEAETLSSQADIETFHGKPNPSGQCNWGTKGLSEARAKRLRREMFRLSEQSREEAEYRDLDYLDTRRVQRLLRSPAIRQRLEKAMKAAGLVGHLDDLPSYVLQDVMDRVGVRGEIHMYGNVDVELNQECLKP